MRVIQNAHPLTKETAVIRGVVDIEASWTDEQGERHRVRGADVLTASPTAHPYVVIKATNTGRNPVHLKGVFGQKRFDLFKRHPLQANILNPTLEQQETTWIYIDPPKEILDLKRLVIYSATTKWPVNNKSFQHALGILRQLQR